MRLRFAAGEKGRGLGRGIERAVVELEGQPRLHLDLALGRQAAQEGHAQRQVAHGVGARHGAVLEVHRAIAQGDVVEGKARRRACGRGIGFGRLGEAGQDVVDVVLPGRHLRQVQHRLVHLQRIQHGGQAQQRCHADVGVHTLDGELIPLSTRLGHGHVMHRELQRPGSELDTSDAYVTPQRLARQLLSLAAQQGRHRQPAHGPQHQNGQHRPSGAPQPRLVFEYVDQAPTPAVQKQDCTRFWDTGVHQRESPAAGAKPTTGLDGWRNGLCHRLAAREDGVPRQPGGKVLPPRGLPGKRFLGCGALSAHSAEGVASFGRYLEHPGSSTLANLGAGLKSHCL